MISAFLKVMLPIFHYCVSFIFETIKVIFISFLKTLILAPCSESTCWEIAAILKVEEDWEFEGAKWFLRNKKPQRVLYLIARFVFGLSKIFVL
jgi:hypothetical protein